MGLEHYSILFIGRYCTDEEISQCKEKLKDVNDVDPEHLFNPEIIF